jgi:hypothetical protein
MEYLPIRSQYHANMSFRQVLIPNRWVWTLWCKASLWAASQSQCNRYSCCGGYLAKTFFPRLGHCLTGRLEHGQGKGFQGQ